MTKFEELTNANIPLSEAKFLDYVLTKGPDNVTRDELIKIIEVHKLKTWQAVPGYNNILFYKFLEENNRNMEKWTRRMGCLTIAIAIMTLIQLYKAF